MENIVHLSQTTERETETERERQTQRERDTERDRERHTQRDRETETEKDRITYCLLLRVCPEKSCILQTQTEMAIKSVGNTILKD